MAATKRPAGINFEKILQSVKGDIQDMMQEYQESSLPINDDNKHLHQLCDRLEFILKFGMKERSVLGARRELWQYFCRCLSERQNIVEGLKIVKANRELKTSTGRSRSFIRYCLVHQCLADVIQQCAENKSTSSLFYLPGALIMDRRLTSSLLGSLYQLCDVPFDLPPTGHDLDVSWPTFARQGTSIWQSPSRTVSMSSLSSFSSQLSEAISFQSPPLHSNMAPVGEDEPTHDCPSSPTSPVSPSHTSANLNLKASIEEISELHQRLSNLEDDNASLRASCVSLQLKLDQAQQDTPVISQDSITEGENITLTESANAASSAQEYSGACPNCVQLHENLRQRQSRCSELENLHQRLENQVDVLQKQVEEFERKESAYKCHIRTLEVKLNAVSGDKTDKDLERACVVGKDIDNDECIEKLDAEVQQSSEVDLSLVRTSADAAESLEIYRRKLEDLEKKYEALQEQCRAVEKEKTTMRTNIHKVSANWFERKTRLSESETESPRNEEIHPFLDLLNLKDGIESQGSGCTSEYRFWAKRMREVPKLLAEISFLKGKFDLAEKMSTELRKRVRGYENVIDDQEIIIHGLKDQLDTFFTDNQKMSKHLSALTKLFEDIELTEKTKVNLVNPPETTSTAAAAGLPTGEDFKELSNSLSKTYIKLKELILEKKSLVTEIERLNILNVELQRRVATQESRLISVSDALHSTWMLISDVKEQHAQLHASESMLRYELKEKRELLHHLREELEHSREQWHKIRQMNSKSEEEWNSIRDELDERRRVAENMEEKGEPGDYQGAVALQSQENTCTEFEPPVDLLLDMAIEYGVVEADDETSTSLVAAMEGEDMHASRLQELEDQCSHLYQKLMASTSRSLTLASRLTALHEHYGSSEDEDDEYEDDDEYEEEEEEEDEPFMHYETELFTPEPESYDTAYVSEADTGSASGVPGILSEEEISVGNPGGSSAEEANTASSPTEEQAAEVEDDLCRGLINFLPRKIEILRRDNQKLEERCQLLQEEKLHSEAVLTANLETEKIIRQQLEEKLEHLGKCVDELKLERNGQISEVEEKLKQKVASLSQREKEYETLQDNLSSLEEKFEERGKLLQIANDRVNQVESELHTSQAAAKDSLAQLTIARNQANEFKALHDQLNSEYRQLKEEVLALQQQIADLGFQVSSHTMERDAAQQVDAEKSEALEAAAVQIAEQKSMLLQFQEQTSSQLESLQNEKDQLSIQVEKLNRILADRDQECSGLNKLLQEAEVASKTAKHALSEVQSKLWTNEEKTTQLNDDNLHLREKIIQLLSRRVRVCDDCFSIHAELATIIASPAGQNSDGIEDTAGAESVESTKGESGSSRKGRPLPIGSKTPDDEEFSVISDDEVQSSRLSSSPSSGSPASNEVITETRATADILTPDTLTESPPTNAEAWVGAGTRVLVPVDLPAGITLHWHFASEPKSVSFAVLHQPPQTDSSERSENFEASSQLSQQRVLIPTTRVASAEGATVKGRLQTKQPGVYTLVFDNSCSRFTAKKVTYSLRLENYVNQATSAMATSSSPPPLPEVSLPTP